MTQQEMAETIAALLSERDAALLEVKRWQQEFAGYAVHDDARCKHFGKCQCGLDDLLKEIDGSSAE